MKRPRKISRPDPDARNSRGKTRDDALFPSPPPHAGLPESYTTVLGKIKQRIRTERLKAVLAANSAMVMLYWDIGRLILDRQKREGWGAKVIDRLSVDLRGAFPDMTGLSPRNLKYMRSFAVAWPNAAIVQQLAAQLPWFHNCVLLNRVSDASTRIWYMKSLRFVVAQAADVSVLRAVAEARRLGVRTLRGTSARPVSRLLLRSRPPAARARTERS